MTHPTTADLIGNATDSLCRGVGYYLIKDEAPTAIKHAVLTIYHSIELFLKARLSQSHPLLIYRSLDNRGAPDSQTVGLKEIIVRLSNLGTPLSEDHVKSLLELQKKRNHIEHFRFDNSDDHETAVAQGLKVVYEFLPTLGLSLEALIEDPEDYRKALRAVLSYTELRDKAKADAKASGLSVLRCPMCGETTLVSLAEEEGRCYFCEEEVLLGRCEHCAEHLPAIEIDELGYCEPCIERFINS